jgi:NurA-like 5'-3' nuclease
MNTSNHQLLDGENYLSDIGTRLIEGQTITVCGSQTHDFSDVIEHIWSNVEHCEAIEKHIKAIALTGDIEAMKELQALVRRAAEEHAETFADALQAEERREAAEEAAVAAWEAA